MTWELLHEFVPKLSMVKSSHDIVFEPNRRYLQPATSSSPNTEGKVELANPGDFT